MECVRVIYASRNTCAISNCSCHIFQAHPDTDCGCLTVFWGACVHVEWNFEVSSVQVATPDQAQEVHAFIRKWLADKVSTNVSSAIRIIYGERLTIPQWPARYNKQLF